MSDSEDDYMSVKFLVDHQEVRPTLLFKKEKRELDMFKKKQEVINKRQKTIGELERENRDKGLNTAISPDNRGFKLLEKMGFKPGGSLGKNKSGIKDPIDIVLKHDKSGVGRETRLHEVLSQKQQQIIKNLKRQETQYRLANKDRNNLIQIRRDFLKAQKVCEELDYRSDIRDPVQDFFWTKDTIKKRRKMEGSGTTDDTNSNGDDEEFEMCITEDNLFAIIDYLRSKHLYCLYCFITGMDIEDLKENCPGSYRVNHDEQTD